ncbi:hypothetical protein, partial [Acinetobacter sp. YH12102]|uniref:hypothetical protein n=1 Tax=Acinetobacter sp. YH12102 TaxID=2601091 RepID=UPI001C5539AC
FVFVAHSLIFTDLEQQGAVIREKSVLVAYCVSSLVDTRSVIFIRNARFRVSQETGKKKASKN